MSERAEKAKQLFYSGYNCAQAVVCAFEDLFSVDRETLMKIADGFGGGMGRMRLTCGAVSAMTILAGLKLSSAKAGDIDNRAVVYEKVRQMVDEFKSINGTIICKELLGSALPQDDGPRPEERTAEYYKKRPCPDKIACCAEICEKYLFDNN